MNQVVVSSASPGVAAVVEILCGLFLQTFGVGHIYAGRILRGVFLMFTYWIVQAINAVLCFVLVGFVGFAIVWLAFVIFSPLWAYRTVQRGG